MSTVLDQIQAEIAKLNTKTAKTNVGTIVTLADGVAARLQKEPAVMGDLREAVTSIPGVDRLLVTANLSDGSRDPVERAAALNRYPGRNGDLMVVVKRHWQLLPRAAATASMHGSPYDYDQRVPIVLFGAGIKPGRYAGSASPAASASGWSARAVRVSATSGTSPNASAVRRRARPPGWRRVAMQSSWRGGKETRRAESIREGWL